MSKFLVVSYTSDWLYPSYQSKEIVVALMRQEKDVSYTEIDSPFGHDSFLIETERQGRMISSFLHTVLESVRAADAPAQGGEKK